MMSHINVGTCGNVSAHIVNAVIGGRRTKGWASMRVEGLRSDCAQLDQREWTLGGEQEANLLAGIAVAGREEEGRSP